MDLFTTGEQLTIIKCLYKNILNTKNKKKMMQYLKSRDCRHDQVEHDNTVSSFEGQN